MHEHQVQDGRVLGGQGRSLNDAVEDVAEDDDVFRNQEISTIQRNHSTQDSYTTSPSYDPRPGISSKSMAGDHELPRWLGAATGLVECVPD
jgi:hypothetical protein